MGGSQSSNKSKKSKGSKKKRSKSEGHQETGQGVHPDRPRSGPGSSRNHGDGRPVPRTTKVSFHEVDDSPPMTLTTHDEGSRVQAAPPKPQPQEGSRVQAPPGDVGHPRTTVREETQKMSSSDVTHHQQVTSSATGTYQQVTQEPELSPAKQELELSPAKQELELYPVKKEPEVYPVKQGLELSPGHPQSEALRSYSEDQEQARLAEMLMGGGPIDIMNLTSQHLPPKTHSVPEQRPPYTPSLLSPPGPPEVYVTADQMTESHFFYKMNHPRRGVALIFNIGEFLPVTGMKRRNGYEVDGELMKGTFARLGFEVQYHADVTSNQLQKRMNRVADEFHGDDDCFACVIMTHGNRTTSDLVFTKDGMMTLDFIVERFNGENCPTLAGKPKLFFVQACRGDRMDPGQDIPYAEEDIDQTDASSKVRKIPVEADILLSQATTPGYLSFRNSGRGSIYIRCLTKALSQYGFDEDLLTVLTRVSAMVAFEFESNSQSQPAYSGKKQMPSFTSQLTRRLRFSAPPRDLK